MPLYQQIIVALPKFPADGLVDMLKKFSHIILKSGGVVRSIENNGVRPLAERGRRKYPTSEGKRYFYDARYITATFDCNPKILVETDRFLKSEESILRSFVLKVPSAFDRSKELSYRNPYMEGIKK